MYFYLLSLRWWPLEVIVEHAYILLFVILFASPVHIRRISIATLGHRCLLIQSCTVLYKSLRLVMLYDSLKLVDAFVVFDVLSLMLFGHALSMIEIGSLDRVVFTFRAHTLSGFDSILLSALLLSHRCMVWFNGVHRLVCMIHLFLS